MKIFNRYTYLLAGMITISFLIILIVMPRFETQEFNKGTVEDIAAGITTTTISNSDEDSLPVTSSTSIPEITETEKTEIEKLLVNNIASEKIENFSTYLLIGSDERDEETSLSRGFVLGKRADVIIIGLISKVSDQHYLLSIPRDTLIINSCTKVLERINASYSTNNCGNSIENLAAAVTGMTGLEINHVASFNFEGFEKIIDSFNGIEICVEKTQKEGYSFELQEGCQIVNGSTALNWVVSRNTEVLVGNKILDANGEDASEWQRMDGVSDLSRNDRQQYVVLELLNKLDKFSSLSELNYFINTLEDSFIIDENFSLNEAIETLWNLRTIDINKINRLSVNTNPYELDDGRQVLIISKNFSEYAQEIGLLDS
ncbi:LCP family protein [Candidatus Actinomarina]|nr:LCP family protein [Candidatus Actinomarina sp.]